MTDERPFVSNAEQRRHEHLSASKPTSADRVSDRLNDLTAERDLALRTAREAYAALETVEHERDTANAANEALRADLERKLAEARKPYADKIMKLENDKRVLMEQVEHAAAQLHTARAERDSFQATLRQATSTLRKVRELTLPY